MQSPTERVAKISDPRRLRHEVLDLLAERVRADAAVFHDAVFDPVSGGLTVGQVMVRGPDAVRAFLEQLAGQPYADLDVDVASMASFSEFSLAGRQDVAPGLFDSVWVPIRAHSALVYNGLDGARFTGQIAVFRLGEEPPFTSTDLRGLREVQEEVGRVLRLACTLEAPPERRAVWVVDGTGQPTLHGLAGDGSAPPWDLEQRLAALDAAGRTAGEWLSGRVRVAATRLRGHGGDEAWLVTADPMLSVEVGDLALLSLPQRQVAAYIARGYTVAETARALHRSQNTVRSHLKAIYAACGISSRAELTRLVDGWAAPSLPPG
jgi:DNA-binding CsgD family transcriptional regulator